MRQQTVIKEELFLQINIKLLDKGIPAPEYAHEGDAGCDLRSRIDQTVPAGERALIPTGVSIAIPTGFAGFVQPRSGLALKHGISIVNAPGLIDSKYRGEIGVILINTDKSEPFEVRKGDKIAQLVIQKVEPVAFTIVDELDETVRGADGFGSTGI
jgi:dUTP pyrophosphatase